jgi:ribosomal protein S20
MANSKSAEKRIEINKRNRLRNRYYKTPFEP